MTMPNPLRVLVLTAALALAAGLLILAPPTNKAQAQTEPPPSLEGETFTLDSGDAVTVTGSCDPDATSTIDFTASGKASPPYEGTFTETGTIVLGPLDSAGQQPVNSITADFTIDSPTGPGQVTGTKTFVAPSEPGSTSTTFGSCSLLGPSPETFAIQLSSLDLDVIATIETPDGHTCTSTGKASLNLFDGTPTGFPELFDEQFTAPFEPTTCDVVDEAAPTTTATRSVEPNAAGWNNEDVTVTLTATDNEGGSGVKEITYSINGGQPTTVQGSSVQVPVSAEGETTIAFYATDNEGNIEQQQTTTVKIDKTAPAVSSISPINNATGVSPTAKISATFSESGAGIDPATLSTSTFTVVRVRPTGNEPVSGTVSYNESTKTVTFTPDTNLARGRYQVTITTGVEDKADNALANDYTWAFSTVGRPPPRM